MYSSTQQVDDMWEEYFSRSDAIRERYACQLEDIKNETLIEQEYHDYMNRVQAAGYGTDSDAYEAYWKRLECYYNDIK